VVGERYKRIQHDLMKLVERGISMPVDTKRFQQDVELGYELDAQHDHLLVKYVLRLGSLRDLVSERFFMSQNRLDCFIRFLCLCSCWIGGRGTHQINSYFGTVTAGFAVRCFSDCANAAAQACRTADPAFFWPSSSAAMAEGVASLPSDSAARIARSSLFLRFVQDQSVKRFCQNGTASSPEVDRMA